MKPINNRIRELREETGLYQIAVADSTGISRPSLSTYENGMVPPVQTCVILAEYFDVSIDYLLGLTNERKPASNELTAAIATLANQAKGAAPSAFDLTALFSAASRYYRRGAPCGDIPLTSFNGFVTHLTAAFMAAAKADGPALISAANDAVISALGVSKMLAVLYAHQDTNEEI